MNINFHESSKSVTHIHQKYRLTVTTLLQTVDHIFLLEIPNVCIIKAMVFPVVMYGCESWTIRKLSAEELMLLNCGVGGDSWESLGLQGDQTSHFYRKLFLNIIGRTVLKLKLQYFGHLMERTDSLEKILMLGKTEGRRRREWQRMRWMASLTWWTWVWASSSSWWWTGRPGVLQSMGSQRSRHDWETELNWRSHLGSGYRACDLSFLNVEL